MVLEVRTNNSGSCLALSHLSIFKIVGCIDIVNVFFLNRLALLIWMWSPGSKMKWRTVIFETSPTNHAARFRLLVFIFHRRISCRSFYWIKKRDKERETLRGDFFFFFTTKITIISKNRSFIAVTPLSKRNLCKLRREKVFCSKSWFVISS